MDYIRKNNETKTREAGFIAQDVEDVLKEVGADNCGMLSLGYDGKLELRYNDFTDTHKSNSGTAGFDRKITIRTGIIAITKIKKI